MLWLARHIDGPPRTYIAYQYLEVDCVSLLVDLPESPVAALIVAQISVVELAHVGSSTFVVQRDRFIQPGRAHGHVHTVHGCCVAGRCNGWQARKGA